MKNEGLLTKMFHKAVPLRDVKEHTYEERYVSQPYDADAILRVREKRVALLN